MVRGKAVQAAKGAALVFDPGERADALLASQNHPLHRYGVFRADDFVFTLEERAQLVQQTGLLDEHLGEVFAADIRVQGGVNDG
jgi:hypothetical protein